MTKNSSKLNKKIAIIVSVIVITVVGTVASMVMLSNNRNNEEYAEQSENYDRQVEIAKKVNSAISDSEKSAEEVASQEIGDDKSKINELKNVEEEITAYKINIPENKAPGLNEIKNDNEKLAEALNRIEENLANLGSKEVESYTISKESKVGVLIDKASGLVEEIKAQAKLYAEEKAAEEAKQKILNGDLSTFEGMYDDNGFKIIIKDDTFNVGGNRVYKTKDMKIIQTSNGSYYFETAKQAITSVTGHTMYMSNSFTISADGRMIEFSDGENLCAYRLTKVN